MGDHAERVMRRLHRRYFDEVVEIKVRDLHSGCTFLSFACKNRI